MLCSRLTVRRSTPSLPMPWCLALCGAHSANLQQS
ncbi:Uncharacterised protein [Vibrio cholerae]|nr:Uncharacterised protein [Vibrio cholerae]